jgi:hypothetical protein
MRFMVLIVDDHAAFRVSASALLESAASTSSGGRRRGSGNRRERAAQTGEAGELDARANTMSGHLMRR